MLNYMNLFIVLMFFSGCITVQKNEISFEQYVQALKIMKSNISCDAIVSENPSPRVNLVDQDLLKKKGPWASIEECPEESRYILVINEYIHNKLMGGMTVIKVYKNKIGQTKVHFHSYEYGIKLEQSLPKIEAIRKKEYYSILSKINK